jgi:phosphoribosylglycinamide formyltransferase-1
MADLLKLGVLISGNGSNLQSIIDHIEKGSLKAIINIVISNNTDAYGITRAKKHKIPVVILKNGDLKNKEDFDSELVKTLKDNGIELVILAGFMRILTPVFLKAFPHKIMNIHPALLPSFPGIHGQKQALEYGV